VQRLRLVADAELKLEAAEAAWRDDKRRAEEAAAAAAEALRALEGRLGEEAARWVGRGREGSGRSQCHVSCAWMNLSLHRMGPHTGSGSRCSKACAMSSDRKGSEFRTSDANR
jgi:hypothetical protein